MEFLFGLLGLIAGIVLAGVYENRRSAGVLLKVIDDYEDASVQLYVVLNCMPSDLRPGETVQFKVQETRHPQK